MIYFKLDQLLRELNISRTKFAQLANVRPNTINDMCNNHTKRIEICTLENILRALNKLSKKPVNVEDILTYIEDDSTVGDEDIE